MQCPFCQEEVGSADDLQLHCLVCTSAYAEPGISGAPRTDCVVVRFRWVKSRPCFEREVHLISSLAGSVKLHWKEDEALYESETVVVPVGHHLCQLAIGGDVVPTEEFEVNDDSDVIFIILQEAANYGYLMFDESDRRARVSAGDVGSDGEPEQVDTHDDRTPRPLDMESRENQTENTNVMSPLYRELLQHQLSHGEPSWVPGSGVQSPVMSDVDLSELAGQHDDDDEPPILTPQPDSIEELQPSSPVLLQPGLEEESRPGDLSGESDGVLSLPDGRGADDQSDSEAEEVLSSSRPPAPPSSSSPVPNSHSEHDSRVSSRESPVNSVPSESGARDDSVISPLLYEAFRHDSPPPITGSPFTEGEHTNVVPPYTSPQTTPGRDNNSAEETDHVPSTVQTPAEEHPIEHAHSSPRASPLGSAVLVLDAVIVPSTLDALPSDHVATSPPERHSPAGSVHSSSLFSSGLPTPIMSPRAIQSDTGMPLASRGSPLGSIQLPLRPQSLGGSINLSEMVPVSEDLLTTLNSASHLESPRGPVSGAEESPISPALRQSPTGSNHSTSVHPQGGLGLADDASRHSSQRSTPRTSHLSHRESGNSTPSVPSPRQRTSAAGSPTELLMETVYRRGSGTPPVSSHDGSTAPTPPAMPSTNSRVSHRGSGNSTPSVHSPRQRTSGTGSPSELLAEIAYRQGTPPVSSRDGSTAATPPVMPSTRVSQRAGSGNSTPSVHSPRHRTSGAGSPTEHLMETVYRRGSGTPPVVSSHDGSTAPTPAVMQSPSSRVSHRGSGNSTPSVHSPRQRTSGTGSPSELLAEIAYRQGAPPVSSRDGSTAATPPMMPSTNSRISHRGSENSTSSVPSPRHRTSGAGSPTELLLETVYRRGTGTPPVSSRDGSADATPAVMPSTSSRVSHQGSGNSTPSVHSLRQRTSGTGRPSELLAETVYRRGTPPVSSHGAPSRTSRQQSPATSVHSRAEHSSPRVLSPPFPHESAIPSHGSAFATVNAEFGSPAVGLSSEVEALRQERDTLARELRQRAAHYEAELRRVRSRNEDLEQQMLSIETVATLTKQDDEKTQELEHTVLDLNRTLREKDEEISSLQESVRGLERTNQQLKEEQDSLKTVNELRLEDMNKLNSDLQQELSDLQRRSLESSRASRGRNEGKIIELQVLQNTLQQHVQRLQLENENLQTKLKQAKQEINTMKAITTTRNGSRLSKAKSETDLSKRFDKYTMYDKHRYRDPEPSKTVSFATRSDSSGLGTTRFSSSDANYTRSHEVGVSSPVIMNGYSSPRSEAKRLSSSYASLHDRLMREPPTSRTTVPRHRVGSLGEDSDVSDDLEHGVGYHTATQPRWRTQSSESSASSVVSRDHDYSTDAARQPRASIYTPSSSVYDQDDWVSGRRRRPHSYHGATGSLNDVHGAGKDDYTSSYNVKSSPYSHSLRDVGLHSTSSSSYSTNPQQLTTTPYLYPRTTTKLFTKPFAPSSSGDIQLGMEVLVTRSRGQIGRGVVKYVGPLPSRKDMYIGVELGPGQEGKHDGSLDGQRLFSCKPNRGIFVSFNKVVMCYG